MWGRSTSTISRGALRFPHPPCGATCSISPGAMPCAAPMAARFSPATPREMTLDQRLAVRGREETGHRARGERSDRGWRNVDSRCRLDGGRVRPAAVASPAAHHHQQSRAAAVSRQGARHRARGARRRTARHQHEHDGGRWPMSVRADDRRPGHHERRRRGELVAAYAKRSSIRSR